MRKSTTSSTGSDHSRKADGAENKDPAVKPKKKEVKEKEVKNENLIDNLPSKKSSLVDITAGKMEKIVTNPPNQDELTKTSSAASGKDDISEMSSLERKMKCHTLNDDSSLVENTVDNKSKSITSSTGSDHFRKTAAAENKDPAVKPKKKEDKNENRVDNSPAKNSSLVENTVDDMRKSITSSTGTDHFHKTAGAENKDPAVKPKMKEVKNEILVDISPADSLRPNTRYITVSGMSFPGYNPREEQNNKSPWSNYRYNSRKNLLSERTLEDFWPTESKSRCKECGSYFRKKSLRRRKTFTSSDISPAEDESKCKHCGSIFRKKSAPRSSTFTSADISEAENKSPCFNYGENINRNSWARRGKVRGKHFRPAKSIRPNTRYTTDGKKTLPGYHPQEEQDDKLPVKSLHPDTSFTTDGEMALPRYNPREEQDGFRTNTRFTTDDETVVPFPGYNPGQEQDDTSYEDELRLLDEFYKHPPGFQNLSGYYNQSQHTATGFQENFHNVHPGEKDKENIPANFPSKSEIQEETRVGNTPVTTYLPADTTTAEKEESQISRRNCRNNLAETDDKEENEEIPPSMQQDNSGSEHSIVESAGKNLASYGKDPFYHHFPKKK